MDRSHSVRRRGRNIEIALQNPNRYRDVQPSHLRPWLADLLAELAPAADSFAARFVDDRAMRETNRRYRDEDATTDVLSFPGETTPAGTHLGDVLISVPVARRATPPTATVETELKRLLLHGVLHCMGHDHESDDGEMEALEARLVEEWIDVG